MRTNSKGVDSSLVETIKMVVESMLVEMQVSMPGKIVKYNKDTQYADVQPCLQRKYEDGTVVTLPVIPNVPVKHPRANGGKAFIHIPLKPGDDVQLVFSHRSLDNWKTKGGVVDPADRRKFHMSDAVAYVGGSAEPDAFKPETSDSIEIVNSNSKVLLHPDGTTEARASDSSKMIVHPDGTYNMYGGNGDDLVQVLNDFVLGVQRALTETLMGPQPLIDEEDPGWVLLEQRASSFTNGSDPYGGV